MDHVKGVELKRKGLDDCCLQLPVAQMQEPRVDRLVGQLCPGQTLQKSGTAQLRTYGRRPILSLPLLPLPARTSWQ